MALRTGARGHLARRESRTGSAPMRSPQTLTDATTARPSRPGPVDRSEAGVALLEVLVTAVVVGIAAIGIAFMYSYGNTWVVAGGDQRVALKLAEQKIEQLRSLGFACIPLGGPAVYASLPGTCALSPSSSYSQNYNEGGGTWVTATGSVAPQPTPTNTNRSFKRLTCVEYVTSGNSPAYAGGTNPTTATCPVAPVVRTVKRITVVVQPYNNVTGTNSGAPLILEGWISSIPGPGGGGVL